MMRICITVLLVAIAAPAAAQDTLEPVRQFYASADYDSALAALDRLTEGSEDDSTIEIDHYRMLCLFALGRNAEAQQAIESILSRDPLYSPSASDAPPRIRAALSDVRQRILPGLVRRLYAEGKAAFGRKALAEATQTLERVLQLLDHPDVAGHSELADFRTLASGFLDLSRGASAGGPGGTRTQAGGNASVETPAVRPALRAPAGPDAAKPAFFEPVPLRQTLPPWIGAGGGQLLAREYRGTVDVEIDERGLVTGAVITQPIHALYDQSLLQAARDWLYEPARRDGQPVKSRKRVNVVLRPR